MAVIDTGVDPAHPAIAPVIGGAHLSSGEGGVVSTADDYRDSVGHGTACAGIVSDGLHGRIEILAVRVVDDQGTSTVRLIEAALTWAVARGARVVNMSLGAPVWQDEARDRLRALCADAERRGVIIIAATGPEGTRALPAVLDEVIAVGSAVCPPDALYVADDGVPDFLAKGDLQRIAWLEGRSVLGQGTSLAAAHVTNTVCRILLQKPDLDPAGVRAALAAQAVQGDAAARSVRLRRLDAFYRGRSPERIQWLRRAAIYPFNKETHALVRFRDLLPFHIEAVADPPGKRLSGRDAAELLGEPSAALPIQPSFERALEGADGVILGHLEAMETGAPRSLLHDFVRKAVAHGKGVYSFSRLSDPELDDVRAEALEKGIPLVDPTVSRAELAPILHGDEGAKSPFRDPRLRGRGRAHARNLSRALLHDCPVLGVFGTSRAQGKLSLQLALRAALTSMGYRVSHLCTEPSGMLFGAAATLPTGYERGNDLSTEEIMAVTSVLVTEIKNRERPDLLLFGGQSSTVPLSPELHRLGLGSLASLSFGAAAQPDACVLVCNPFDPPEHVARCRGALESVLQAPVIAAAFGDQTFEEREWKGVKRRRPVRLGEVALHERLGSWEARLGVPCCGVLSAGDRARLGEIVVEYFASVGQGAVMA
ncbi:Alkaline serine protease, subtilase family protein [Minicystis rosea]|nr:Alkaline serine protease, subtilase family protein [Minicystis rosea]